MAWFRRAAYVLGLQLLNNLAPVNAQDASQTRSSDSAIHVSVDRVHVGVTVTGSHGILSEDCAEKIFASSTMVWNNPSPAFFRLKNRHKWFSWWNAARARSF